MSNKQVTITHNTIFLLLGFFSTTPIISIPFGSRDIAVFRIIFYGLLIILFVEALYKGKIRIGKNLRILDLWLVESLLACVMGWVILHNSATSFANNASSYIPKVLAFLLFALVWGNQDPEILDTRSKELLNGIMYGCLANLIWAVIDGVGFYTTGRSINNIVFSGYIIRHNVRYGMLSLLTNTGLFRAAGFNSDPAQIGFIAPIVICYALYEKKYWMILLAILGTLTSASTTALVTSIIVVVIWLAKKKNNNVRITTRRFIAIVLSISAMSVCLALFGGRLLSVVDTATNRFYGRLNTLYFDSGSTSSVRWKYIYLTPKALLNLNVKGIFGLGFGTASYGYVTDNNILAIIGQSRDFAFDPENTYISYLFDTGIVGFILFLTYLVRLLKYFGKKVKYQYEKYELIEYAGVLATVLSMLFYHYILFTPQVFIIIAGLSLMDMKLIEYNYSN